MGWADRDAENESETGLKNNNKKNLKCCRNRKPQMQARERGSEVKEQEGLVFCYDRPQADKVLVLRANPAKPSSKDLADA